MANYIQLNYGDQSYNDSPFEGGAPRITVLCNREIGLENFKDPLFDDTNEISIYELPEIIEMGSGGGLEILLPEINQFLVNGVKIAMGMTVAGFFGYFGQEIARALIDKLKNLNSLSHIEASGPNYHLEITVPANLSKEDCAIISEEINKLSINLQQGKTKFLHITYDKETKKTVKIEEIDRGQKHI